VRWRQRRRTTAADMSPRGGLPDRAAVPRRHPQRDTHSALRCNRCSASTAGARSGETGAAARARCRSSDTRATAVYCTWMSGALLPLVREERRNYAVGAIFVVVGIIPALAYPYAIRLTIDEGVMRGDAHRINVLASIMLGLLLSEAVATCLRA